MQNRRRGQGQVSPPVQSNGNPQVKQPMPLDPQRSMPYRQPIQGQAYPQPNYSAGQRPVPLSQGQIAQQRPLVHGTESPVPVSSPRTKKILRLAMLVLVILNISAFGLSLFWSGLTFASQSARQAEQERVVKNHPLYFRSAIEDTASRYNLQAAYVSAIIKNESSFRTDARSNVGALGLMQLMPDTAEWIAGKLGDAQYSFERLADGKMNMEYGCWYLNFLSNRFWGDPILTTAAYHTGQGKVANWLSDKNISQDGRSIALDNMPDGPTKTYVRRVLEAYAIYDALYFRNP